ncbi:MAG: beta-ketoacyl synthase chain length factor [Burkholderiales bacterium]|nr:beta-ketoacyl synthase chain length factor [Burkholderiales bacterium]
MTAPQALEVAVLGVGLHGDGLGASWSEVRARWRGETVSDTESALLTAKPQATLLPPAERRRAPATVSLALAVAEQACRQSGLSPQGMRSVFCSAHGDLEITDYLCATLAESPEHLSPTKFHHSVHNAASGYWTIGVGNRQASTAMSAGPYSFAQALLEAAIQAISEQVPVLLVAYDMPAPGRLAPITQSTALLGIALVLAPPDAGHATPTLALRLDASSTSEPLDLKGHSAATTALLGRNPMAVGLPLLESLANIDQDSASRSVRFAFSQGLTLDAGVNMHVNRAHPGAKTGED